MSVVDCCHKAGDTVVYRKQGIYNITDIKEQKIGGVKKDYYVLCSVYDVNSTLYIPVDSEALTSQMERVLTTEEVETIIRNSLSCEVKWIENSTQRFEYFDEIVKSGNLEHIIAVLRIFLKKKENSAKKGVRYFARDERVYSAAQKAVTEAFAYPLGINKQEVIPYIVNKINEINN